MRYYSTKNSGQAFSFSEAALSGLAPDGGLFIPQVIPRYRETAKNSLLSMSFPEIAIETIMPFVEGEIPGSVLEDLCAEAFSFDAPLVPVNSGLDKPFSEPALMELFHGPTAAFKDFGARFMARTFSYLRRGAERPLRILVATSGDTGGAVADGFFGVEGISVTILYPKGRVSELQEKQIAGLGGNISALAVEGSFDDCQAMVKSAFTDRRLQEQLALSSANSINISRLIPQAVYYSAVAGKAQSGRCDSDGEATPRTASARGTAAGTTFGSSAPKTPVTFCVPSGNFGNLTAGLYALSMGAPIAGFIAATNINKTVPDYLESGEYKTRISRATISNAMDVGAPSNFERMASHWNHAELRQMIQGVFVTDDETRQTIKEVYQNYGYYLDPHGAVGWTAVKKTPDIAGNVVVAATAHPAKFSETVESITGPTPVPAAIKKALGRTAQAETIPVDLSALRDFLLST
ncbi:MAG: threonine synthase [Treponema sp.]|nr:threonine synthase [Treponema sp.]